MFLTEPSVHTGQLHLLSPYLEIGEWLCAAYIFDNLHAVRVNYSHWFDPRFIYFIYSTVLIISLHKPTVVLPGWSNLITKIDSKGTNGAPGLLIVTSAATRATDVVR